MDIHFLLQGIFPTQALNLGPLPCRQILYHVSQQRSPYLHIIAYNSHFIYSCLILNSKKRSYIKQLPISTPLTIIFEESGKNIIFHGNWSQMHYMKENIKCESYECSSQRLNVYSVEFSSVQSLSRVRLFATPWITARQASLSITNSRSTLRLTAIESVMPSNHLILCRPLLLLPSIPPIIRLFQWVNSSHEVVKVLKFQL